MKPPVLLLVFALALANAADAPKTPVRVDGELQKRIDKALEGGRAFLSAELRKRPLGEGQSAPLALHALLHAGLPVDDTLVSEYLKDLPKTSPLDLARTYQSGILALVLSDLHDPKKRGRDFKILLQQIADVLSRAQGKSGSWDYPTGKLDMTGFGENISTAQYALLGLQAASNRGARVPDEVWRKAASYFLDDQQPPVKAGATSPPPAGWGYGKTFEQGAYNKPYGAMTAVGIASLLICSEHLPKADPLQRRIDASVDSGIQWLGEHFSVKEHPGIQSAWAQAEVPSSAFLFYYLYSLERAGSFAATDRFGKHAWYPEGARFLVDQQQKDGSWVGDPASPWPEDALQSTSFALLFLKRASAGTTRRSYVIGGRDPEPEAP